MTAAFPSCQLSAYGKLRKAADWAAEKLLVWDRDALAATFMVHEPEDPIHATLTDDFEDETPAAAALAKTALKMFKNVMGFMGDRKMNYPTMLAKEVLEVGLANAPLRNELYLQLIKQLTKNQNPYAQLRNACVPWHPFVTVFDFSRSLLFVVSCFSCP